MNFQKILEIVSIPTNIYQSNVCDPLDPYISLVNNSIDLIIPINQSYVCDTLGPYIYLVINFIDLVTFIDQPYYVFSSMYRSIKK